LGPFFAPPVVGYRVRHEKTTDTSTRVAFLTDGVLLREVYSFNFNLFSFIQLIG